MESTDLTRVLTEVFSKLRVKIQSNHNSDGSDTHAINVPELGKSFIFDAQTGKFLGVIDAPVQTQQEQYRMQMPMLPPAIGVIQEPFEDPDPINILKIMANKFGRMSQR